MKNCIALILVLTLLLPVNAFAGSQDKLMKKIDMLTAELAAVKAEMQELKDKDDERESKLNRVERTANRAAKPSPIRVNGEYRWRFDSLSGNVQPYWQYQMPTGPGSGTQAGPTANDRVASVPVAGYPTKNKSIMSNRLVLNMEAKATENISVRGRAIMYKTWGHQTLNPITGYFGDRAFGAYDGIMGHVPMDSTLRIDQAFASIKNIGGKPVWFSVGRRPSTGGIPTNLRQNIDKDDDLGGIPGILVDYAFDGLTLGYAPDVKNMPGFYTKFCYGRGFDSGYTNSANTLKDTDFYGFNIVPYNNNGTRVELQWQKGYNIFDTPSDGLNFMGNNLNVSNNLGDIEWLGLNLKKEFRRTDRPGGWTIFGSYARSKTDPNTKLFANGMLPFMTSDNWATVNNPAAGNTTYGGFGLLYDDDPTTAAVDARSRTGHSYYIGARYDFPNERTKLGVEYNKGSQYWIGMVPAADDLWTSKLGTRGNVFETYLIHELKTQKYSPWGKAFLRLGYQKYKFDYTGSNNWVGAPKRIDSLTNGMTGIPGTQMLPPLKDANDLYMTLNVTF